MERAIRLKDAMCALESLTPSGSEFVGDIENCVAYIRRRQTFQHEMIIKAVKARHIAEAEVLRLKSILEDIGNVLGTPVPAYFATELSLLC
jgi:hypothetical protein